MNTLSRFESIILFFGDIVFFLLSLYLMLIIRYQKFPEKGVLIDHLIPFSILFIVWVLVFFIAGLYEKHTLIFKRKLPSIILNALIVNSIIAVIFFYFISYFGITPKTNLFIYLGISFILFLIWRSYIYSNLGFKRKQNTILVGSGHELYELKREVNGNNRYNIYFTLSIDLDKVEIFDFQEEVIKKIYSENINVIVADLNSEKTEPLLPNFYNLIFSKVKFFDMHSVYEDIFDRIPLSITGYSWFLENVSSSSKSIYDFLKRTMDILVGLIFGILSLVVYPFVILALKLEDGGDIFSIQTRVGQNNKPIKIFKFRTMSISNDGGNWGSVENKVTKVGDFLRKGRIDELPQLWNVLKGDISLIGPRPEFAGPVAEYVKNIPYYNIRHIIKPGLSGWAQIKHENHPHHTIDINETHRKLSYDLYYIKNRSFILDIIIAIKTLKVFITRSGA